MPAYRSLVDELTRGARDRAARTAQSVLTTAGLEGWANDAGERVARLADEVAQTSRANRELFDQLVSAEVGRVAGRLGLVPRAELHEALERVSALDEGLRTQQLELDELRQGATDVAALRLELAELTLRLQALEGALPEPAERPQTAAGADAGSERSA